MTNTSMDTDDLVRRINDEKVQLFIPDIAYISVLMVTGLLGNLMVCYYYGFRTKMVHTSVFILTLATYDVIVCAICMPGAGIVLLVRFYTFKNAGACRFIHFITNYAAIASLLTLIAIAVDRYRHICGLRLNKMTVRDTLKHCAIVAGVAVLVTWPSIFIYEPVEVPVPNKFGLDLHGTDCTTTKAESYIPYVWAFNGIYLILFTICSVVLVVLYSKVCRVLYRHRKKFGKYREEISQKETFRYLGETNSVEPDSRFGTQDIAETKISRTSEEQTSRTSEDQALRTNEKTSKTREEQTLRTSEEQTSRTESKENSHKHEDHINKRGRDNPSQTTEQPNGVETKHSHQKPVTGLKPAGRVYRRIDKNTAKITVMMFVITSVFFLSCIPYLCLAIWRSLKGQHEGMFLSDGGLVGFQIGIRSYLLNSTLNPWIYGIFNSQFRQFYYKLVCCKSKQRVV